jgi:D-amino-acid dehydrogenase
MEKKSDILIIGGGIIGLSSAVELARLGAQVRVVEKNQIGMGCSYGNAGWLTPCFAMPLPMPGLFFKSIKWLLDPEGPLYIKPSLDPLLIRWLLRFMASMNEKQTQAAIEAMVVLSQVSLELYRDLALEFPEIAFESKGLLMVAQSQAGMEAAQEEMHRVAPYQVPGQILAADELKRMEPAITGKILGGVYFPKEAHAEPLKTVQALARKARSLGVEILENTAIEEIRVESNQVQGLKTVHGELQAQAYVLATGSWSTELAKQIKLSVPILGGKGYALIVPPLSTQPVHPLMLIEKKIAITPRNGSLRIAGTLELVNQDFSITQRRVDAILRGSREFLPVPENPEVQELWRGLRPCTPDGVPLIGFSARISNLMLACGHQMLGLQSGFGTGKLVAELMMKGTSDLDRSVYDPNRF